MSTDCEKKKLNDLRVVDLKSELEKRGKESTGNKSALLERLTQALIDEDEDPEDYEFDLSTKTPASKKSPVKAASQVVNKAEENEDDNDEDHIDLDGFVVKDELDDQEEEVAETKKNGEPEKEKEKEKPKPQRPVVKEKEVKKEPEPAPIETKDVDNEDSLNLTIGEEDEKLLHEHNDSNVESDKKDDSEGNSESNINDDSHGSGVDTKDKKSSSDKDAGKKKKEDEKSGDDKKKADEKTEKSDKTSSSAKSASKDDKDSSTTKTSTSSSKAVDSGKSKTSPTSSTTSTSTVSRNLWVSGLASLTRATDLKQLFSKFGKVIGAKVVTNTRTPGTRCYGYVTMASAKDATECISNLHRTELHGRMISVERAKSDLGPSKPPTVAAEQAKETVKKVDDNKEKEKEKEKKHEPERKKSVSKDKERSGKDTKPKQQTQRKDDDNKKKDDAAKTTSSTSSSDKNKVEDAKGSRPSRDNNPQQRRPIVAPRKSKDKDVLSYQKIRDERERQRLREKERELREEERRRREIRRRQREEEQRLHREREKLAQERARIEKEKAELLRIERERQKLEREKIELERLELKRQQRKIEEAKRSLKRPASDTRPRYDDDRKRPVIAERRFEAPPPPRFETAISSRSTNYDRVPASDTKKRIDDYSSSSKRDDYSSSKRDDYKSSRDDYKSRGADDYKSRSDDYKRDAYKQRSDDYKREMDPRHSGTTYDNRSSGGVIPPPHRSETSSVIVSKETRYADRPATDYRSSRGDDREPHSRTSSTVKPRYIESQTESRYAERGAGGGSSSNWHSSGGHASVNIPSATSDWGNKPADAWRAIDTSQDRYDRTYNERKAVTLSSSAAYIEPARQAPYMGGSRPQERYNNPVSARYENGRY